MVEIKTPRNLLPSKIESNPMGRQGYLEVSVGSSVYRLPFWALSPGPGLAIINLTSFRTRAKKGKVCQTQRLRMLIWGIQISCCLGQVIFSSLDNHEWSKYIYTPSISSSTRTKKGKNFRTVYSLNSSQRRLNSSIYFSSMLI